MENQEIRLLSQHQDQMLPPELLLDEHHPANDQFIKDLKQIQRMVVTAQAKMKQSHVQMVKARVQGERPTDIAERMGVTVQTVSNATNSKPAQRLSALLAHHQLAIEGPTNAQRANMLWRIAKGNEKLQPRTAISAVDTLNKMSQAHYDQQQNTTQGNVINIQINQNQLPKTSLDN